MKTEPPVSVVIVNFNCSDDTVRCLESIARRCDQAQYEIIVVDNASRMPDFLRLKALEPGVRVLRNEENLGFGAANNRGARVARGSYLFFLNPDTILLNDAIGKFLEFMESTAGHGAGAAGCYLEDPLGNENHSYGDFASMKVSSILRGEVRALLRSVYRGVLGKRYLAVGPLAREAACPRGVDWITGADLFMRRTAFEEVGGFDERIFLYSEEVDLQLRLKERSWLRWVIDGPRIVHKHGRRDRASAAARLNASRGLFSYLFLHEPAWIVRASFVLYKGFRCLAAPVDALRRERSIGESFDFARKLRLSEIAARAGRR